MPQVELADDAATRFRQGQTVPCGTCSGVVAVLHTGELLGLGEALGTNHVKPTVVLG
jgi:NOL1/NOP2/fmu family ribosome biogenesis protein